MALSRRQPGFESPWGRQPYAGCRRLRRKERREPRCAFSPVFRPVWFEGDRCYQELLERLTPFWYVRIEHRAQILGPFKRHVAKPVDIEPRWLSVTALNFLNNSLGCVAARDQCHEAFKLTI